MQASQVQDILPTPVILPPAKSWHFFEHLEAIHCSGSEVAHQVDLLGVRLCCGGVPFGTEVVHDPRRLINQHNSGRVDRARAVDAVHQGADEIGHSRAGTAWTLRVGSDDPAPGVLEGGQPMQQSAQKFRSGTRSWCARTGADPIQDPDGRESTPGRGLSRRAHRPRIALFRRSAGRLQANKSLSRRQHD